MFGTQNRRANPGNSTSEISRKEILGTILLTVISLSMVVIGSMYLQQCPVGKYIPVYLLVGGLMGLLIPLLCISTVTCSETNVCKALKDNRRKLSLLIMCLMLCWSFIGSYWIYSIYEPKYGKECHETLYLFAFWLNISIYLTVAIVLVAKMCIFCYEVVLNVIVWIMLLRYTIY